jgi:hypothetical protein
MRHRTGRLVLSGISLALTLVSCTTTYTESDLAAKELKQDQASQREEKRDEKIDEEKGGASAEQLERDRQAAEREADL